MNIILKTKFYLRFSISFSLLLGSLLLRSQDIHFSQYYNSPLAISPALTGISSGDLRLNGVYRSQWNAADSPFKTIMVSADNKFFTSVHPNWWFSAGMNVFYDRAGDANLENTNVQLSGSYTRQLDRQNFMTVGISAGFGQRRFDFMKLTFDDQWNGTMFESTRTINENFEDTNILYPDFGIGFNWRGQGSKVMGKERTKIDLGAGAYHLTRPDQAYQSNDDSRLPIRMSIYLIPVIQLNDKADFVGNATFQVQGEYREALAGAAYRYHLSTKRSKEIALQFGVNFRFNSIGDALIPAAELHYHFMRVGLSWDINVSDFSAATNRNGGPELTFRYIIKRVRPISAFKACPLI